MYPIEVEKIANDTIRIKRRIDKDTYIAFRGFGSTSKEARIRIDEAVVSYNVSNDTYQTFFLSKYSSTGPYIEIQIIGVATNIEIRREIERADIPPVSRDTSYLIVGNIDPNFPSSETVHILIVMENHGGGIPQD